MNSNRHWRWNRPRQTWRPRRSGWLVDTGTPSPLTRIYPRDRRKNHVYEFTPPNNTQIFRDIAILKKFQTFK